MRGNDYSLYRALPGVGYETAVERVTEALKEEGFGILTEIDVRSTFKRKLDLDFRRYLILGACNPQLAHRALSEDEAIGVMLPCNVVVAETEAGSEVLIGRPQAMIGLAGSERLAPVADEAEERLSRALGAL